MFFNFSRFQISIGFPLKLSQCIRFTYNRNWISPLQIQYAKLLGFKKCMEWFQSNLIWHILFHGWYLLKWHFFQAVNYLLFPASLEMKKGSSMHWILAVQIFECCVCSWEGRTSELLSKNLKRFQYLHTWWLDLQKLVFSSWIFSMDFLRMEHKRKYLVLVLVLSGSIWFYSSSTRKICCGRRRRLSPSPR